MYFSSVNEVLKDIQDTG